MMDETLVQVEGKDKKGQAITSFVLGLFGIIAWFIPIFGLPVTIVGLIMGIKGRKSSKRGLAIAGIVLCTIFLIITLINAGIGAYQAVQNMDTILEALNQ